MWDERYSSSEYVYGKNPNDFLKEQASKLKNNSKILCIAEGEGRNAVFLAELGHEVDAVDSSSVGAQKANKLAKERGVAISYEVADLKEYEIKKNSYDAIVAIFAHTPKSWRSELYSKIKNGLKNDGIFILEGYTPEQLPKGTGGPKDIELFFSGKELQAEFEGFKIEICDELERNIQEGQFHNGDSSVVQFLSIKSV